MMPTLTQQQMDALQTKITNGDIAGFYSDLEGYGDSYGTFGLAVTNNAGWQGKLANLFAETGAEDDQIDLGYQSTAWNTLNSNLAQRYLDAYETNQGGQPTRDQIQTGHNNAYTDAQLDADDWFPNRLLNDASDADALWADFMVNEGASDMYDDMFAVLSSLPSNLRLAMTLGDVQESLASLEFGYNFAVALWKMDNADRTSMALDVTGISDLVNMLNNLPDAVDGFFDNVRDALDDPNAVLDKVLPNGVTDFLTPFDDAKTQGSPLIIDLDGDGIEATAFNAATTTTFFDLNNDGFAEQTAWVGAHDGLLVRDIDASGTIDDASELFGSVNIDGFAILQQLDSNSDLVIDQYDSAWNELLIWKDANGDAISQAAELKTLDHYNITSIDLADVAGSSSTVNGNPISHTSTVTMNGASATIADVWFVYDHTNTASQNDYTLNVQTLFLPTLRGFGTLSDLHVSMSGNATLLNLVKDFATDWTLASLTTNGSLDTDIEAILYNWANVQSISTNSRGSYVDAQHLEFLEEYVGEEWRQYEMFPNPFPDAGDRLEDAWDALYQTLKSHLLLQAEFKKLFAGDVTYDVWTGEITGSLTLDQQAINDLVSHATAQGVVAEDYWIVVADILDAIRGLDTLTTQEEGWLDTAVQASDATLTWSGIETAYYALTQNPNGSLINGTAGDDTLTGTIYDDEIHGSSGNDTLEGRQGDDLLYGDNDNDVLDPGEGGDFAYGGSGNDDYYFTGGGDVYNDTSGTERIYLPSGITSNDLTFSRINGEDLLVEVGTLGSFLLENQFDPSGGTIRFEKIVFHDTSELDLSTKDTFTTYGTEAGETIWGIYRGALDIDDTIYGLAGDDNIDGRSGDDVLDGGEGNDYLTGNSGNDTFVFSPGFDTISDSANGSTTETVLVPLGYGPDDLTFFRTVSSPNELLLTVTDLGQMKINYQFFGYGPVVDYVSFADGSPTIDITNQSIETVGTSGNDNVQGITSGASTNDVLNGREGDDTLYGNAGDDTYIFSEGNDLANDYGSGFDTVEFRGNQTPGDITIRRGSPDPVFGFDNNSLVISDQSGNSIKFAEHFSYVSSSPSASALERLVFGDGTIVSIFDLEIETHGTANGDQINSQVLSGDASTDDTIYGHGGNDTIVGGVGNDLIYGGDGNDTVFGDGGNDTLYGDAGDDYLYGYGEDDILYGGTGIDTLNGGNGSDHLIGGDGDDTLIGESHWAETGEDVLEGGAGNDSLTGGNGLDTASYENAAAGVTASLVGAGASNDGDGGTDTFSSIENLTGSAHNDDLTGDGNANTLKGLGGDDTLYGHGGADVLYGAGGADTFVFKSATVFSGDDTIKDFSTTDGDAIDIADVIDYDPLTDVITDFVQITDNGVDSFLAVDWDGGANNFIQVATIEGVTGLTDEAALVTNGNLIAA